MHPSIPNILLTDPLSVNIKNSFFFYAAYLSKTHQTSEIIYSDLKLLIFHLFCLSTYDLFWYAFFQVIKD